MKGSVQTHMTPFAPNSSEKRSLFPENFAALQHDYPFADAVFSAKSAGMAKKSNKCKKVTRYGPLAVLSGGGSTVIDRRVGDSCGA